MQAAVLSRAGLNLRRLGHDTSHAGLVHEAAGKEAAGHDAPWTVRQLYYDCTTGEPRVFDEGLPGFVLGMAPGTRPRLSAVWWPGSALKRTATDDAAALALVGPRYQANAHAWSTLAQNCNQWLAELLAFTLAKQPTQNLAQDVADTGGRLETPTAAAAPEPGARRVAQDWLAAQGFEPSTIELPWAGWLVATALLPHLGLQHHPQGDLDTLRMRVVMPASIEGFIQGRWPQSQRLQWCLNGKAVVVREGWAPLNAECDPDPTDRVVPLDTGKP